MSPQNPVALASEKYTGSLRARYELIGEVTGEKDFSTPDHLWLVKD